MAQEEARGEPFDLRELAANLTGRGLGELVVMIAGVILLVVLWQLITGTLNLVGPGVLPSPVQIYNEFMRIRELILNNLWNTIFTFVVSFTIASLFGIGLAVLITWNHKVYRNLEPFVVGGNAIPRITLAPVVLFYWDAYHPKFLLAILIAFFPVLMDTMEGLAEVDEDFENLMATFGASKWQTFRHIRFPNALPFIFDGLKLSFLLAAVGTILAEFLMFAQGLGGLILVAMRELELALAFSILIVMGAFTMVALMGFFVVQSRIIHWRESSYLSR